MATSTSGTAIPNPNLKPNAGQCTNARLATEMRQGTNQGSLAYRKLMGVAPFKPKKMLKIKGGKLES